MKNTILILILFGISSIIYAEQVVAKPKPTAETPAITADPVYRPFKEIYKSFQVQLSLDLSGPVLFNDTPDGTIDELTALNYGGGLAFILGDELKDFHHFGLGFSYHLAARSANRELTMLTPYLVYEIGNPLMLQIRTGYTLTSGTKDFVDNYKGIYGGISLKYSFTNSNSTSPVSVAAGIAADVVISSQSSEYSTVFMGLKLEIVYHK